MAFPEMVLPEMAEVRQVARDLLAEPLPRRWAHVQAVGARAEQLVAAVSAADRHLLVVAAWWHDIGYAPALVDTGFHPVDGARFLRSTGHGDRLCGLVAFHSAAHFEADERGLTHEQAEFVREETPVADALAAADMTTGPTGERLTFDERIAEIFVRYPPSHIVHRAIRRARPYLAEQVRRTAERIADV